MSSLILAVWLAAAWAAEPEQNPAVEKLQAEMMERYQARDYAEAARLARESVEVAEQELGADDPYVGSLMNNLAVMLKFAGDYEAARPTYERAIAILEPAPEAQVEVAMTYNSLARLLQLMGEHDEAIERLNRAEVLLETANAADRGKIARSLVRVYNDQGELEQALHHTERWLGFFEAAYGADDPRIGPALEQLARLQRRLGHPAEALEPCERAIALLQGTDLEEDLALLIAERGSIASSLGRHDDARRDFEHALAAIEAVPDADPANVGFVLNELGLQLYRDGRYDEAQATLERALDLGRSDQGRATRLNNIALVLRAKGDLLGARKVHDSVLEIRLRNHGEDHPYTALTLHNLASLSMAAGDAEGAMLQYARVLAIRRRVQRADHPDIAITLNNLAVAKRYLGMLDEARDDLDEAVATWERALGPDHPNVAKAQGSLAGIHLARGDTAAADKLLAHALPKTEAALGPEHPSVALLLTRIGELRTLQGNLHSAREAHERALAIRERALGPVHTLTASSRVDLAGALEGLGDVSGARTLRRQALAEIEALWDELVGGLSEREALALMVQRRTFLDAYLADEGVDPIEAWQAVLRWKGAATRSLRSRSEVLRLARDPALAEQIAQLADVRKRIARWSLSSREDEPEVLRERIADATAKKERLERALAEATTPLSSATEPVTTAQVCEQLPERTALLDLLRYQDQTEEARYVAFSVSASCEVSRVELGPAEVIDKAVSGMREALGDPQAAPIRITQRSQRVHELVWEPVAAHIRDAKRVLVVPDAALASVPFAVLPAADERYLIEELDIAYLDNAAELLEQPSQVDTTRTLLVGGIDYAEATSEGEAGQDRAGAAPCVDQSFGSLPGTLAEIHEISRLLERRRQPVDLVAGDAATEELLSASSPGYRRLHLATHGFFATGNCRSSLARRSGVGVDEVEVVGFNPMVLSGLVLAGANAPDPEGLEDGIWTAEEVATLDLRGTELVVLSACETGLGEVRSGEGVLGLRRAFAAAGAQTLVTSLWAVPDSATAEFMGAFYSALLQRRRTPSASEALRAAQLEMLAASRERNADVGPQAWGGFISTWSPQ